MAELGRRGVHVTGVDPSPVMIAQAQRRNRAAISSGHVQVLNGESGSLPVPTEPFGAVLAIHTIYLWPDLVAGLREIRGVGGVIAGLRLTRSGRWRRARQPRRGHLVCLVSGPVA